MSQGFVGWGDGHQCRAVAFDDKPASSRIVIAASVGTNGANYANDVQTVQRALNGVPAHSARPAPLLIVDGLCGPKTKDAIQKFQLHHFGWSGADGRVDPGGQTIAKLNELNNNTGGDGAILYAKSNASQEPDPVIGAARVARIRGLIGRALECIKAAQSNSLMALPVVESSDDSKSPFPSLGRASLMAKLNIHFDIDSFPRKDRLKAVNQVLKTYNQMESVFSRPGGLWGAAAFDYDRLNKPYYAYTYPQGFYHPGRKLWTATKQVRYDAIYFCKKLDDLSDDMSTFGIIHELSHFAGFPERIRDHGYGWIDDPRMKKLLPSQRIYNGMSYGNFAYDVRYGKRPLGL